MKSIMIILLVLLLMGPRLCARELPHGFPDTPRSKACINTAWQFHLGDPEQALYMQGFDDSDWEEVSLPHTLKLTSIHLDGCQDDKYQKTFHRDVGWYRKQIPVTKDPQKKVFLEFEGAHQVTDLWINGQHVGQYAISGYTPFHFDISSFVTRGQDNLICLRVDNRIREDVPPDPGMFDYIKFSGLYRDVYLVETNPLHITFNWEALDAGIFITTPTVDPVNGNAIIDVKTVVRNEYASPKQTTVVTRVLDKAGLVVLKLQQTKELLPGQDQVFKQIGAIEDNLHLWSIDDPYLYRVNSMVLLDGKPVDVLENRLGIRKFQHDPMRGFLLNEKPIKLIGFNRHQHYGYIGDALPDSLHTKDMWQLKQLGCNVVRTAHYPQDNALLDTCDELGILVYEEAPTWIAIPQNEQWFENYDKANRVMIRNHRNHPSVVIWGAGINHRGYVPQAVLGCKQEDPTRLTASQSSRWTGWQTSGLSDLFANMMYGPGLWDRSEPLLAMEGWYGPKVIAEYKRDPLKTGMISWTAHAYYTFHPSKNPHDRTRLGMMTIFREPKAGAMWYPAEFRKEPFLHIEEPWQADSNALTVYSNAEAVELVVNGRSFARQKPSAMPDYQGLDHAPFHFDITAFEPGELTARGIIQGAVIVSQTIHTPETAHGIELTLDTEGRSFVADGSDILVGYARVVDNNGTIIQDPSYNIHFSVTGPASVVGDGIDIGANPLKTKNGTSPVLIRAGKQPGKITITARAEGLISDTVSVTTTPKNNNMITATAGPIYDFEKIRVDIGASDQLVQFDWIAWNGDDNQTSQKHFQAFDGFKARLKPASSNGFLRWLGEMNVIGKYGFAYGEGVLAIDNQGLQLELVGLPKGRYRMRTWHHAPRSNTDSMDPNRDKLKKMTIHKLPYASELEIVVKDINSKVTVTTGVTAGKEMQSKPVAVAEFLLDSDGVQPIEIKFSDPETAKGIWLNAFELSQWYNQD
ncbi:glycoside hydrolase family 2 TIM barrel-domain containing protein [Planctomycetota bacterium]